jgi:hypothetical protein
MRTYLLTRSLLWYSLLGIALNSDWGTTERCL